MPIQFPYLAISSARGDASLMPLLPLEMRLREGQAVLTHVSTAPEGSSKSNPHASEQAALSTPVIYFGGQAPVHGGLPDNKWNIQATIEFEYKIPSGSDRMSEIARAIQYCRHELA